MSIYNQCENCDCSIEVGTICVKCYPDEDTDFEIADKFFKMLKRNGVKVKRDHDNGPELLVFDTISNNAILNFCFHEDGSYWRIMGYPEKDYFVDDVHKQGWK